MSILNERWKLTFIDFSFPINQVTIVVIVGSGFSGPDHPARCISDSGITKVAQEKK